MNCNQAQIIGFFNTYKKQFEHIALILTMAPTEAKNTFFPLLTLHPQPLHTFFWSQTIQAYSGNHPLQLLTPFNRLQIYVMKITHRLDYYTIVIFTCNHPNMGQIWNLWVHLKRHHRSDSVLSPHHSYLRYNHRNRSVGITDFINLELSKASPWAPIIFKRQS